MEAPDIATVTIWAQEYFMSIDGQPFDIEATTVEKQIPAQIIDDFTFECYEEMTEAAEDTMKTMMILTILESFFANGLLNFLWGLISSL